MRIFLICFAFFFATPLFAQDTGLSDAEASLSAIYASTTDMAEISVTIENGVATLTGDVANADIAAEIQNALPIICLAILAFLFMWWLGSFVAGRKAFWQRISPNPFLAEILSQTIRVLFIIGGLIIALNFLGAQAFITTILGGAGVVGIALGFAVRDTLENYLASIMLSLRQPFRAGDHVLIGDREGKVMRLTSRATILMTMDGNHLRIPNSTVFKAVILNYTTNPDRRFTFSLGVDAADDPVAAMQTGLDVICVGSARFLTARTDLPRKTGRDIRERIKAGKGKIHQTDIAT